MERHRPWWKAALLNARALACGVVVAVALVSAYVWAEATLNGGVLGLTPVQTARAAAGLSGLIALQLLVMCVPVWLLLKHFGLVGRNTAVLLGFTAPLVFWFAENDGPFVTVAGEGLPFAGAGALAGLVVWQVRAKRVLPPVRAR